MDLQTLERTVVTLSEADGNVSEESNMGPEEPSASGPKSSLIPTRLPLPDRAGNLRWRRCIKAPEPTKVAPNQDVSNPNQKRRRSPQVCPWNGLNLRPERTRRGSHSSGSLRGIARWEEWSPGSPIWSGN